MAQYVNPGDAFTSTFEDAVMQSQDRQRQAKLDALAVQRENRMAAAQMEELRQGQEALAIRRDQANREIADTLRNETIKDVQMLRMGDIPDAELVARAKKYHVPLRTSPMGSTLEQAPPEALAATPDSQQLPQKPMEMGVGGAGAGVRLGPQPGSVLGTPEEERKAAQDQRREKLGSMLETVTPGSPEERALFIRSAINEGKAPTAAELKAGQPEMEPVYKQDPRTGTVVRVGEVPKGSHFMTQPAPVDPLKQDLEATRLAAAKDKEEADKHDNDLYKKLEEDPQFLVNEAVGYNKTFQTPTAGMGAKANASKLLIRQVAAHLNPDNTWTDPKTGVVWAANHDLAGNRASYDANKRALSQMTTQRTAAKTFLDTADKNSKILEDTLKKIPDSDSTDLNTFTRHLATRLGSNEVAAFNTMLPSVRAEYARVIQQPTLTGVLSDTARKEVGETLPMNATVGQLKTALKLLRAEGKNRVDSFDENMKTLQGAIKSTGAADKPDVDDILNGLGIKPPKSKD